MAKKACAHGYILMQDSCPGCDHASENKHAPEMVRVMGFKGRDVSRCTQCGQVKSHPAHTPVRERKRRRAVNTNRQGANFELQIMSHLAEHGYDVARSSGSRGKVDVFAIGDGELVLIQAKISKATLPPAERLAVLSLALRCGAVPVSAWRGTDGVINYRELTGPGPFEWDHWVPTRFTKEEQTDG